MKYYIGIDNGVSGAVGIVSNDSEPIWFPTPIISELSYTKKKQYITRIDHSKLYETLSKIVDSKDCLFILERPMINPTRFSASISAARSLESTLIIIESLKKPFEYTDSKFWQNEMLPSGLKDKELKEASKQIGKRLFPQIDFGKCDADAILIAEWARRKNK